MSRGEQVQAQYSRCAAIRAVLGVASPHRTSGNLVRRSGTHRPLWTDALLLLVVVTDASGGLSFREQEVPSWSVL